MDAEYNTDAVEYCPYDATYSGKDAEYNTDDEEYCSGDAKYIRKGAEYAKKITNTVQRLTDGCSCYVLNILCICRSLFIYKLVFLICGLHSFVSHLKS